MTDTNKYQLQPINNEQALQLLPILESKGFHHLFRFENQIQCQYTINFVDNEADPTIVLLLDSLRGQFSVYPLNEESFIRFLEQVDWSNGFLTQYKDHPLIDWNEYYNKAGGNKICLDRHFKETERVVFAGILQSLETICISKLSSYFNNIRIDDEIFDSLVLPVSNVQDTINNLKQFLDGNECLLTIEDAEKVNEKWKYKSNESINFLKIACTSKISGAYRIKNENGEMELASWIIHYTDGSIGNLYTDEKYRGRGLAKKVAAFCTIKMLENGYTKPYCYINIENKPSQSVMRGIGFQSQTLTKWIIGSKN